MYNNSEQLGGNMALNTCFIIMNDYLLIIINYHHHHHHLLIDNHSI